MIAKYQTLCCCCQPLLKHPPPARQLYCSTLYAAGRFSHCPVKKADPPREATAGRHVGVQLQHIPLPLPHCIVQQRTAHAAAPHCLPDVAHSLSGPERRLQTGCETARRVPLLSQLAISAQWATAPHPDEQVRAAMPATEGEAAAGNVTRVRHVHRCVVPRSSGQWQSHLILDEWVAFSVLQRQPAQPRTSNITLARQSIAPRSCKARAGRAPAQLLVQDEVV